MLQIQKELCQKERLNKKAVIMLRSLTCQFELAKLGKWQKK